VGLRDGNQKSEKLLVPGVRGKKERAQSGIAIKKALRAAPKKYGGTPRIEKEELEITSLLLWQGNGEHVEPFFCQSTWKREEKRGPLQKKRGIGLC